MSRCPLPDRASLPDALLNCNQWLCWRTQKRDSKPTKVPVDPHTGGYGSATDESTWSSFKTAREHASTATVDGVGFVFTDDDPFVGIDLDDCRDLETESTTEWATAIIDQLDSYTERSPSGTEYHVIVRGSLPTGRNRKGDIELYETARFFTVTGDRVEDVPTEVAERNDALDAVHAKYVAADTPEESASDPPAAETTTTLPDETLVDRATSAENGEKFQRLWNGDTSMYDSHSEADMALCSLLAFWTGGDRDQIDRVFRNSGLLREKWDEVHYSDGSTYGEKTIERAIAGTSEFYEPQQDDGTASDGTAMPELETLQAEVDALETREQNRFERVEELATEIQELQAENERLREDLEAERVKRRELELQGTDNESQSFWAQLLSILGWSQ